MQQDTKNKFAEILAAAQSKVKPLQTAISPKVADIPKPIEHPKNEAVQAAKMLSFTILWQEGSGRYDGKTFTTWNTANDAMRSIYNEHEGAGYLKVKINVKWEDGSEITDRADCSDSAGDFCPKRNTIGEYLQKQNSCMYASNLNVGDRVNLSFEDTYLTSAELSKASVQDFINSPNFINDVATDNNELSTLTIEQLLNEPEQPQQTEFTIIDYSDKSFAICTAVKPSEDILNIFRLHGTYNAHLKCGKGWIFSKRHLEAIKAKLSL